MGSAARVTSAAEGLPRRRFTVAEVEAMVAAGVMEEDERVELIGGELVPMSPKGNHHEVVKTALLADGSERPPPIVELTPETTFRLSEDTYLEPDVVVYPSSLEPKDLRGQNVLLVVEIADSSKRYDMGRKAKLYASFGVRELWVIDAVQADRAGVPPARRRRLSRDARLHRRGTDRPAICPGRLRVAPGRPQAEVARLPGDKSMPPAAKLTTSAAEGLPRRRFTVAEVEAMVAAGVMEEDERVELIGGELVPMSPKGNHHEVIKTALLARWYRVRPDDFF